MVTLAGVAKARSIVLYEAAVGIGVAAGPLIGGVLGQSHGDTHLWVLVS